MEYIDAQQYLNLIRGGAARLAENRQSINDLNVFPIPDGDTGDNMYMTIQAGCRAQGSRLDEMAQNISKGMLMGARGNSGVILSRIFAGISKAFQGLSKADARAFSRAMQSGVEEAYHAVAKPVEGTILTVFREGVEAASDSRTLEEFLDLWIAAMDLSLQHTPELLDILKKAGVVDSGGAGMLCIGEGMRAALHGEPAALPESSDAGNKQQAVDFNAFTEDSELEFGYCTEFLLRLQRSKVDLEHFDETVISDWLSAQGDSLVFFRDGSIVKVHVHTMDPGAVLSHCRQWGEFLTIKVENMTLQHHENHMDERFKRSHKALGIVTVASGEGLTALFKEMGADAVIAGGQTMNPPVERFIEAFDALSADTILVFPNNSNILLTARQAASLYQEADVQVIPTHTLGEGYFALANMNSELSSDELVASLTEAAASVTTGTVSKAVRDAREAHAGDYIGFCGKDILVSGKERRQVVVDLAARLNAPEADILVLFQGADAPAEEASKLRNTLEKQCPRTEVILLSGGQAIYDYILMLC